MNEIVLWRYDKLTHEIMYQYEDGTVTKRPIEQTLYFPWMIGSHQGREEDHEQRDE